MSDTEKLSDERLRQIEADRHNSHDARVMARELLALRSSNAVKPEPVAWRYRYIGPEGDQLWQWAYTESEPIAGPYDKVEALYAAPPASPVIDDTAVDTEWPSLSDAHAAAWNALSLYVDACHEEETNWTGWGDQIVPPYATTRRVKAEQAMSALRDSDPKAFARLAALGGQK